jgi:hypothetical protein
MGAGKVAGLRIGLWLRGCAACFVSQKIVDGFGVAKAKP